MIKEAGYEQNGYTILPHSIQFLYGLVNRHGKELNLTGIRSVLDLVNLFHSLAYKDMTSLSFGHNTPILGLHLQLMFKDLYDEEKHSGVNLV